MNNLDFTLLEYSQIFGENRLDIFEKYGIKASITDFAILLGGFVSDWHTNEGNDLKDRTGYYFTKTYDGDNYARAVTSYGSRECYYVSSRNLGARPALPYSSILGFSSKEVIGKLGDIEVEYGEYPQTIVNENLSNELERLYNTGLLKKTGKEYSTDSARLDQFDKPFEERKHIEYEYNGEKYIRILGDYNSKWKRLSDGRRVEEGKPYFVKVEPIVWMIDKERDIAISKKLLFSGVQFNNERNYKGDFNSTDLHYYLENYFSKDIVPSKIEKPKLYLINFSDEKGKYYPAYEVEYILRELYTNIELVPEDANYYPENALKYHSKKLVSKIEYYPYVGKNIEIDTKEYLDYLFELCIVGSNEKIYDLYEEEYKKRKAMNNEIDDFEKEMKVDELIDEQVMKLVMK